MNVLSVIGVLPPLVAAVASKFTNASRELAAPARFGTGLTVSFASVRLRFQPARVFWLHCGLASPAELVLPPSVAPKSGVAPGSRLESEPAPPLMSVLR
jgi:hypothetical protein